MRKIKVKYWIYLLFGVLLIFTNCNPKKQNKAALLLAELNKLNNERRDLVTGQRIEITVDTFAKVITIDNTKIPLNNYTANYQNAYNSEHKKYYNVASFTCLNGDVCLKNVKTNEEYIGVGFCFQSKEDCIQFITLVDKINQAIRHSE